MNRFLVGAILAGLLGWVSAERGVVGRPPPRSSASPAAPAAMLPVPAPAVHSTSCYPYSAPRDRPAVDPRPLVWVLDGAGDLKGCSKALAQTCSQFGETVELVVFPWSHGYRRLLKDQTDWNHARMMGARFAAAVRERQAREPGRRTIVVAHSAGCAVALTSGEVLPSDSIDRMILLAPSVSSGYNIRPALWSAREGVDVFCSKKDWVALGFVTRVVGTMDRFGAKAAGRHGFEMARQLTDLESRRLRQHFWTQDIAWTGHNGGHHGVYAPAFLHAYVFPLMEPR